MAVIRSIERRRGGVVAVTVDEEAPIEIPLEAVLEHGLHEGSALSTEDWTALRDQLRQRLAVRRSLEFLAQRRRTRAELRQRLLKRFSEAETNRAMSRIEELGYLDDESWAQDYVATPRSRGRGRALLARELSQRGIEGSAQERALAEHDDLSEATTIARKRLRSLRRLEPDVRDRRLYAFLRRRGFGNDTARQAMDRAIGQSRAEPTGADSRR